MFSLMSVSSSSGGGAVDPLFARYWRVRISDWQQNSAHTVDYIHLFDTSFAISNPGEAHSRVQNQGSDIIMTTGNTTIVGATNAGTLTTILQDASWDGGQVNRWIADNVDGQGVDVDFGSPKSITRLGIAKPETGVDDSWHRLLIQSSQDGVAWDTILLYTDIYTKLAQSPFLDREVWSTGVSAFQLDIINEIAVLSYV